MFLRGLMPRYSFQFLLCIYVEPRLFGSMLILSVFHICLCPRQVAAGRWYASLSSVILSHHCGFYISHVVSGPVGVPHAMLPSYDVMRFLSERRSSQLVSELS